MANILVTGGLGFQGSRMAKKLLELDNNVIIISRHSLHAEFNYDRLFKEYKNLKVVWGDITNFETIRTSMRGINCIFNFAAQINVDESRSYPSRSVANNIYGAFNVLEASRQNGNIPIIHASSCEVYGTKVDNLNMDENHPMNPMSPYAATKAGSDRLVYSYYCTYDLPIVIARPGNVYGYGQKSGINGAVIPKWINLAINNKSINIFGDGNQGRDFVYIDDVIDGYLKIYKNIKSVSGNAFNLGSNVCTKMKDIAKLISKEFDTEIIYDESRPGEVKSFSLDSSKANELIGWKAKVNIDEGLKLTIDETIKNISNKR